MNLSVEHILLFLICAFLAYHMMGKCRRVEGATTQENECKFFGCAPLGFGTCPSGWTEVTESNEDTHDRDGINCVSGKKIYCCPPESPAPPPPPPKKNECKFFGTAPLCDGKCPPGWKDMKTNSIGGHDSIGRDGEKCLLGKKVFCCPPDHPECEHKTFSNSRADRKKNKNELCENYGKQIGKKCKYRKNKGFVNTGGKCVNA